jgi:hypothetical protein
MIRARLFSLAICAVLSSACASSPSSGAPATQQQARPRGQRDLITLDELATIDVQNALQAVQRLRPNFLRFPGAMSITQGQAQVVVYVESTRMGGPDMLQQIPITEVKEIRYLSATDATQRYGTGHTAGAIIVTRK